MNERYIRQLKLKDLGHEGQAKLREASVLLVGTGGLGCPAAIALSRAGVGKIGLADHDVVSLSNLHRQTLYKDADIGLRKVDVAKRELLAGNPEIEVTTYDKRINEANWSMIIQPYDVVLDCSDNFPTRYLVNDACCELNKPLVYGAANQLEGQLAVFNVGGSGNLRDLFPEIPLDGTIRNCEEAGVLGAVTALVGDLMALETIKLITGMGDLLINTMLVFDGASLGFHRIRYQPQHHGRPSLKERSVVNEITWLEYEARPNPGLLVDVRTIEERERQDRGGLHLPVGDYEQRKSELQGVSSIVFYCQSGQRAESIARKFAIENRNVEVCFISEQLT